MTSGPAKTARTKFSSTFWLAIVFEFFERGAYYGMMSILSVYFTDLLFFSKESVGTIKSVIQPVLYFLPIVSGALADRFGYRRTLVVAFALLGTGYLLTSQFTTTTAVFLSMVVLALGAGTFKPVISGTIARTTDSTNSSLGFGVYYWSINLGAFLFPLILVPWMKNTLGWHWVIILAGICTGVMIIPTLLLFREPPPKTVLPAAGQTPPGRTPLIQTLANAFEIVFSPLVLVHSFMRRSAGRGAVVAMVFFAASAGAWYHFWQSPAEAANRPVFFLFLIILGITGLGYLTLAPRLRALPARSRRLQTAGLGAGMILLMLLIPGISTFARILCGCIYLTQLSLLVIDTTNRERFRHHFRFLLMIFIYSGFWVLYFQMFDSVLWYVKASVDATPLNEFVNRLIALTGIEYRWFFDVEHVTSISAGTIIALQLFVSRLVEKRAALPTMITGICIGTAGMAVLAISPHIWVFILGTVIFAIGEMTAHPKFISYVGQTAPPDRVALYMGYVFLYGVIGSGIGGVLGANLYVHFVDGLHQPRMLWLIFSGIGAATAAGLLLFNRFAKPARPAGSNEV